MKKTTVISNMKIKKKIIHWQRWIYIESFKSRLNHTSLGVQWLRIHLPGRGHGSDPWEDSTCCGATNPTCHNDWACEPRVSIEPTCCNCWSPLHPRACSLYQEKPPQWEARVLQLEFLAATTRENLFAATKTQLSQEYFLKNIKNTHTLNYV